MGIFQHIYIKNISYEDTPKIALNTLSSAEYNGPFLKIVHALL